MTQSAIVYSLDPDRDFLKGISSLCGSVDMIHKPFEHPVTFLHEIQALQSKPIPSCILLEIKLPVISGIELIQRIKQQENAPPVIVLTGHADVPSAVQAMKYGAFDFIEKPFQGQALIDLINLAIAHHRTILNQHHQKKDLHQRFLTLSKREKQVLELVVAGKSSKHIAEDLGISIHTVDNHRANIMAKMCTDSVADLVRAAVSLNTNSR